MEKGPAHCTPRCFPFTVPVSNPHVTSSVIERVRLTDLPRCNGKIGGEYFRWVSNMVNTCRGEKFNLKSPPGATLVIGPLEDTTFKDAPAEVNKWGKFYLPTTVEMQVVGYVEGSPYPCDQLVLMTCEDKKFYAYDEEEEELHLVATSLDYLREKGIDYPASKSYYRGEAFKDMTKEDWSKVREGPVGKRLDEQQRKLVAARKSRLLENLKNSRRKQRCHQQHGSSNPDENHCRLMQRGGT